MRFIYIIALVLLFAVQGHAAEANIVRVYTSEAGDTLVLSSDPCTTTKGEFANYPVAGRNPNLKAAKIMWKGKPLDACWMDFDGVTMVVDETGDSGAVEGSPFDVKKGTTL